MKFSLNRLFFVIAIITVFIVTACGDSEQSNTTETGTEDTDSEEATSDKEYDLRLATVVNPPHPWIDVGEFFAEEVEKRTDGNVKVTVHDSATLGEDEAIIDEMQLGTIDFIIGGSANAAPYVPQYQMFVFSYLFDNMEHFEATVAHDSKFTKRFKKYYEENGLDLKLLGLFGGGTRYTSHKDKEITEASDMEGVKMRLSASPLQTKVWSAVGAVPTTLPWNEVYSGVQTGVVDSFESTLSGYEGSKLYEVAPYIAKTEHLYMGSHFTMSGLTEEKLPDEYNEIIEEVGIEAAYLGTELGNEADVEAMETLKDEGVTFSEVDKESFKEKMEPLYDELAEDIDATELLEIIRNTEY